MNRASTQVQHKDVSNGEKFNYKLVARARRFGFLLNSNGLFTWPDIKFVTSDETEILKTLNLKK